MYKPTQAMSEAAKRGLRMREEAPPSQRGGTRVGLARARQFAERREVSLDIVRRTYSFLSRAAVYYKPGEPTKGTQAYLLWGGPAGLTWSRNILRQEGLLEKERKPEITERVREVLRGKVEDHNEEHGSDPAKRVTLSMLEEVFRRGVGAYYTSPPSANNRPTVSSPDQWAYARVNTFLSAVRNGRFPSGRFDTDLLPEGHPMSTRNDND